MKAKDITTVSVMAAVICVCSWISVPCTVPFTMQTFGVFAALLTAGGKKGTLAIALYILLGALGLPVFSGFQGGIGHLLGPTGGYIIGFLFMGAVYSAFENITGKKGRIGVLAGGLWLCYGIGTLWFTAVSAGEKSLSSVISLCVLPYIIPDLAKLLLASYISEKIQKATRKAS